MDRAANTHCRALHQNSHFYANGEAPGGEAYQKRVEECPLVKVIPFVVQTQKAVMASFPDVNQLRDLASKHERIIGQLQTTIVELQQRIGFQSQGRFGNSRADLQTPMRISVRLPDHLGVISVTVNSNETLSSVKAKIIDHAHIRLPPEVK